LLFLLVMMYRRNREHYDKECDHPANPAPAFKTGVGI
jgi:hypothetical protein